LHLKVKAPLTTMFPWMKVLRDSIREPIGGRVFRTLAAGSVLLAIIVVGSMLLISGGFKEFLAEIASIGLYDLAVAASLMLLAETVKALRLKALVGSSFLASLYARLIGRFAGTLTPGGIGGTPTRAAIIGAYTGTPIGRAMGASILETMGDSLVPAVIVLLPAVSLLPGSAFILLMSVFVLLSWLGGLTAVSSVRVVSYIYSRVSRLVSRTDLICMVEEQRRIFMASISAVKNPRVFSSFTVTTIVSHALELASILYFYYTALGATIGAGTVLEAFFALEATYVMVAFITPGGSGAVEYGLSVFLPAAVVVKWRLAQILVSVLPGFAIIASIPRLREYLRVAVEPSPSCREGAGNGPAGH